MFLRKIFSSIIFFIICLTMASPVFAINFGNDNMKNLGAASGYAEATNDTTLSETIGVVIQIALSAVGVIFLALMVYAGFIWMTARGDAEAVKKATGIIKTCVIGLIVVLAAYSITSFVVPKLVAVTAGQ